MRHNPPVLHAGVRSYAADAEFFFRQHQATEAVRTPLYWVANYDNSAWAAALMVYSLLDLPPAQQQLLTFFRAWMTGRDALGGPVLFTTPRGLAFLGEAARACVRLRMHACMCACMHACMLPCCMLHTCG